MKPKIYWFLTVYICFCMVAAVVSAQEQPRPATDMFKEQLKVLEDHYKNLEKRHRETIELLNERFEAYKGQVDARVKRTEFLADLVSTWLGPITAVGLLALGLALFRSYRKIPEIAEKETRRKFAEEFPKAFERLFNKKEDKIREIIERYDEEIQLKRNKSLMVLGTDDAKDSFAMNLLRETNFYKLRYETFKNDIIFKGEDLVLLDNEKRTINEDQIIAFSKELPKECIFFCFGMGYIKNLDSETARRCAFSSVRFQLYGNLINALRYQGVLKQMDFGSA